MTIDGTNAVTGLENVSTAKSGGTGESRVKQKQLGQEEFFKLLTTQLASQDPLKPMEDTAFIAQMANFSQLEMTSQLTKSFEEFTSIQQFSAAHSMIGKRVSLVDGGTHEGTVTSIERQNGQTLAFLNGEAAGHDINSIYKVDAPSTGSSTTTP